MIEAPPAGGVVAGGVVAGGVVAGGVVAGGVVAGGVVAGGVVAGGVVAGGAAIGVGPGARRVLSGADGLGETLVAGSLSPPPPQAARSTEENMVTAVALRIGGVTLAGCEVEMSPWPW